MRCNVIHYLRLYAQKTLALAILWDLSMFERLARNRNEIMSIAPLCSCLKIGALYTNW